MEPIIPQNAAEGTTTDQSAMLGEQESRGLRFAGFGLLGLIVVFCLLTIPVVGAAAQSRRPAN